VERTADKARVPQDFFLVLLLTAKVGEGVDDNAEDKVQHDDNDDKEEYQVIDDTCKEQPFLKYTTHTMYIVNISTISVSQSPLYQDVNISSALLIIVS